MASIMTDMKVHHERSYSYNRFQEKGVELQKDAKNWWEAKRDYNKSCLLCCMTNRPGATECSTCPIREAMLENAEVYWKSMPLQEYAWVEKERQLY